MLNSGSLLLGIALVALGLDVHCAPKSSRAPQAIAGIEPSDQVGGVRVPSGLRLDVVVSARQYDWRDLTLSPASLEPADTFTDGDTLYLYAEVASEEEQTGDTWVEWTTRLLNAQGTAVGGKSSGGTFLPPTQTGLRARHGGGRLIRNLPPGRYTLREEASNADHSIVVRRDVTIHIR
jgi:hypothetical protein